ncbi:hypothetical protein NKI77_30090 [Mesorhizobium opportunistum]|uniref:DUF4352 domain-containing protein n=1 Tax=Mesorhizobium opportunistum TaxID=593909 RepID=A0ABV1YRF3_9HYPH|nr:hypothetical protein [Mesorhizobium sp.]TIN92833.1 MAG: hypothetical protein E5Y06_21995 [Mesorhizobium sp.]TJU97282.1 MAG: hypothetical protein E5Y08_17240 [Mesorhizobium sp.]TJV16598.1 MAG: hypothetical protein E5Y07_17465 [Mesorhizobium sp.]
MLKTARSRVQTWITAGAGTIAALFVAGLMGAFGALPAHAPPQLPPDTAIDAGRWRVQPVRAYVSHARVHGVVLKPGQKALVLEADMTNRTAQSDKAYFDVFRPDGIDLPDSRPMIALTRDATLTPELDPGMTERMAYVWPLAGDAAVPSTLAFGITAEIFKPRDNLYGTPGWYNPYRLGTVTLPVVDVPATETPGSGS